MVRVDRIGVLSMTAVVTMLAALAACGRGAPADRQHAELTLAAEDALPAEVRQAPVAVREAYRFALANRAVLEQVPCYCGCGAMGHTSNAACYLGPRDAATAQHFDGHALGCSICVDITQDVMRLLRQGKPMSEIRSYVDARYGPYGPSNLR